MTQKVNLQKVFFEKQEVYQKVYKINSMQAKLRENFQYEYLNDQLQFLGQTSYHCDTLAQWKIGLCWCSNMDYVEFLQNFLRYKPLKYNRYNQKDKNH